MGEELNFFSFISQLRKLVVFSLLKHIGKLLFFDCFIFSLLLVILFRNQKSVIIDSFVLYLINIITKKQFMNRRRMKQK